MDSLQYFDKEEHSMFNIEIHHLIIRGQDGDALADWESQYLDAALSPKEQEDLGALATKLRSAEFLEELVDTCDYDVDTFAEVYHIDHDTVARWMEGNMTSFERRALEFMLLHEAYDENRVHCCPICGRIHFKVDSHMGICEDCWLNLDDAFVRFIVEHKEAYNGT